MTGATHINAFSGKKITLLKEYDHTYTNSDGAVEVIPSVEYMKHGGTGCRLSIFQKPFYVFRQTYSPLK